MVASLAGAAVGILVNVLLVRLVTSFATEYVPTVQDLSIDSTVLLFAMVVAFVDSVLFSVAPLWQPPAVHRTKY
jgi:hypothetical protein